MKSARHAPMLSNSRFHTVDVFQDHPLKHEPTLVITQLSHPIVQAHKLTVPKCLSVPEADSWCRCVTPYSWCACTVCSSGHYIHWINVKPGLRAAKIKRFKNNRSPPQLNSWGSTISRPLHKHDLHQEQTDRVMSPHLRLSQLVCCCNRENVTK